jgi:DeoR/GlpR family transcriptional regulator of sugar metabolism
VNIVTNNTLRKDLTKYLKSNPRGLTLKELAELTKVSTITAARSLAHLEGEKKIDVRRAGSAKLHYWRN